MHLFQQRLKLLPRHEVVELNQQFFFLLKRGMSLFEIPKPELSHNADDEEEDTL